MSKNQFEELLSKVIQTTYLVNSDENEILVIEFTDNTKIEIQGEIKYFF